MTSTTTSIRFTEFQADQIIKDLQRIGNDNLLREVDKQVAASAHQQKRRITLSDSDWAELYAALDSTERYGHSSRRTINNSINFEPTEQLQQPIQKPTPQPRMNITEQSIRETLASKFIKTDELAEVLYLGYKTQKNVFLYGRGGHGKSVIIEEFIKMIDPTGQETFIQACGEGMTEEKLFGGLNMKRLNEDGVIEYNVEDSFMNKKYVILEEMLDARKSTLLSLKDVLTSGWFRQGSQQFKIRTEMVIVLTNRTKQEVSDDNSIKALMERFPLEMKVEWDSYGREDYRKMFNKVLGQDFNEICEVIEDINNSGSFISPRTAIHLAECYQVSAEKAFKYIGIDPHIITEIEERLREARMRAENVNKIERIGHRVTLAIHKLEGASAVSEAKSEMLAAEQFIEQLKQIKVHPSYEELYKEVYALAAGIKGTATDKIMQLI